jgi:hypothetical protein
MKKIISFMFLCVLMNVLVAMESQKDKQEVFDDLLVAMITDNIRSNRVKVEKAYPFKPKLVGKFPMGRLHIPPIDTLAKPFIGKASLFGDDFPNKVIISMPFSIMIYTSLNTENGSCVNIYNKAKNAFEGEYIGTIEYDQKNITGLGFTADLKYLIATFDNNLVSKTELYNDEDYKKLMQKDFLS